VGYFKPKIINFNFIHTDFLEVKLITTFLKDTNFSIVTGLAQVLKQPIQESDREGTSRSLWFYSDIRHSDPTGCYRRCI